MTTETGMLGFAPGVLVGPDAAKDPVGAAAAATAAGLQVVNPEQAKYAKLWGDHPEYRGVSPGEQWAQMFLNIVKPERDSDAIDFGCGTGRGGIMLALLGGMKVNMLDFASNSLDGFVADACVSQPTRVQFHEQDLTNEIPYHANYGYCCDVMEHIPTADVPTVLKNILASAHQVFFGISTVDDVMGALIGEALHLTVEPMSWWVEQLKAAGAVINWCQEIEGACGIYCTSWAGWVSVDNMTIVGKVNTSTEELNAQTEANIRGDWLRARPYETQETEVILLGGGPSINNHVDEIKKLRADGCMLVTTNGAYSWAISHGLVPSGQVVLDAREFNARFVQPVLDTCRYFVASQAHPETLAGLPKDRTYLWHSGISESNENLERELNGYYFPVPGGSTVMLRAIPLLRMLGYKRFHVFGLDSCVLPDGTHHAYEQPENSDMTLPVSCAGRTFQCTGWQFSQANEFRDIVALLGDTVELNVVGDGLIAHMLRTSAAAVEKAAAEVANA